MAHGSSIRALSNRGSFHEGRSPPSAGAGERWRKLSEGCRLAVVEQSLRADRADGLPVTV